MPKFKINSIVNTFADCKIILKIPAINIRLSLHGSLRFKTLFCSIHRFTISICYVISQPNLMALSLKELEQSEYLSAKSTATIEVTTKYKKRC